MVVIYYNISSMNLNKTFIVGNFVRKPEIRATQTGKDMCAFTVATNNKWKDKSGETHTISEYHSCVAFDKMAGYIFQYANKGDSVLVEGRLQTRSWEDKETNKKNYKTEVVVEKVQLMRKNNEDGERSEGEEYKDEEQSEQQPVQQKIEYPAEVNPDDIPF